MSQFSKTVTVDLRNGSPAEKKAEIKDYFLKTMATEEALFDLLKNDAAFYQRPERLRHPLIFYFGHTFTFYVNKLYVSQNIEQRLDANIESMLAIGVDEMSWDDLDEKHYDWPSVDTVRGYRQRVRDLVLGFIDKTPLTLPINWESPFWVIMMGIEHHCIHVETSSVLIRQLSLEHIVANDRWQPCSDSGAAPQNTMKPVKGGTVTLGKGSEHHLFGWDNEYGKHTAALDDFSASQFLVSNGEFNAFVEAGGYEDDQWWTEEGCGWRQFSQATMPGFWVKRDAGLFLRTLDREIPLSPNWPVEVNYLEARAFCNWKSAKDGTAIRLPTEDEWGLLRNHEHVEDVDTWPTAPGNINLEHHASSCPVDKYRFKDFYDVVGNVWQWTETPIYPFDGFKVHPIYDDFTVPTFDCKHNLIKGGSWISTGNEATRDSRYAFRRHFTQHAGFRYVNSDQAVVIEDNPYETDYLLSQYCEFHFGQTYFEVANFPEACIKACQPYIEKLTNKNRALDLGCALGRATLELAKHFDDVVGLDFSARFIDKAQQFVDSGTLRYILPTEGELVDHCQRDLKALALNNLKGNVAFLQADACNLHAKYSDYDFIFCGNLIDRLHSPAQFLTSIHERMNAHGILVLTSPYTWLEDYTPKSKWIGGYKRDGENLTTLQGLDELLGTQFKRLADTQAIPFVIRETQHKFQHTLAEMTVWQKRS